MLEFKIFKNMKMNFEKLNGLIPAIIQDAETKNVLMLGFMNLEAYNKTVESGKVTFFSRTKNRLWTKGEESGNFLNVVKILIDCDNDTLLILANPDGPTCHTGTDTCFGEANATGINFLLKLEKIIEDRKLNPQENSYTSKLFAKGIDRIAQKVGEEAIETVIASKNENKENFVNEVSDLLYHLIVLTVQKNISLSEICKNIENRN